MSKTKKIKTDLVIFYYWHLPTNLVTTSHNQKGDDNDTKNNNNYICNKDSLSYAFSRVKTKIDDLREYIENFKNSFFI